MLRAVRDNVLHVMLERFGANEDELRLYFHYHPGYWHLHLHITHWSQTRGTEVDDVIGNLERDAEYYMKCAITTKIPRERLHLYARICATVSTARQAP